MGESLSLSIAATTLTLFFWMDSVRTLSLPMAKRAALGAVLTSWCLWAAPALAYFIVFPTHDDFLGPAAEGWILLAWPVSVTSGIVRWRRLLRTDTAEDSLKFSVRNAALIALWFSICLGFWAWLAANHRIIG